MTIWLTPTLTNGQGNRHVQELRQLQYQRDYQQRQQQQKQQQQRLQKQLNTSGQLMGAIAAVSPRNTTNQQLWLAATPNRVLPAEPQGANIPRRR